MLKVVISGFFLLLLLSGCNSEVKDKWPEYNGSYYQTKDGNLIELDSEGVEWRRNITKLITVKGIGKTKCFLGSKSYPIKPNKIKYDNFKRFVIKGYKVDPADLYRVEEKPKHAINFEGTGIYKSYQNSTELKYCMLKQNSGGINVGKENEIIKVLPKEFKKGDKFFMSLGYHHDFIIEFY